MLLGGSRAVQSSLASLAEVGNTGDLTSSRGSISPYLHIPTKLYARVEEIVHNFMRNLAFFNLRKYNPDVMKNIHIYEEYGPMHPTDQLNEMSWENQSQTGYQILTSY